jgi:hypothetical protein
MNLLDSHDTERLRWTLTPGTETTANKEVNADNVAQGKLRQQLASLIQFTVPGAPTVFYGDEVGMTGDDDPDDRRTYPWADKGGSPDQNMFNHYKALNALRSASSALISGDFDMLLADDAAGVVAYGRKTTSQAAVVIINRSSSTQSFRVPVAGYLWDGMTLNRKFAIGTDSAGAVTVAGAALTGSLGPQNAVVFMSGTVDLQAPAAPSNLNVTSEGNATVSLAWSPVSGSTSYNLYRSYLSGGGWVKVNGAALTGITYTDTAVENARTYYYVVTALDAAGNESGYSNQASALPRLSIGWANLQWPPTLTHTISAVNRTNNVYGQVWIDGATNQPGATPALLAQLGYGPSGSNPDVNSAWIWVDAAFNTNAGNNDEFVASLLPESVGTFDYAYRYSTTNGATWVYADLDGIGNGYSPAQAGKLTVSASTDSTAPDVPANVRVLSASPAGVDLEWDANVGDASLYGYEVLRSGSAGGTYTTLALVTAPSYTDSAVEQGATYYYVVRAVDQSFNRSGYSAEVSAKAEVRTVNLVFSVTVPATTDGTGRSVYIAGFLDRLDGGLPQWNPGGVVLTRVDATHWTITLTGKEATQIEYKYTLGDWEHGEKGASCDEISNRQLTLSYGADGTQTVSDTVLNWRNVAPCGN